MSKYKKYLVDPAIVEQVKRFHVLTYFTQFYPDRLFKRGNDLYVKDYNSVHISEKGWYRFSQDKGGKSALDYLMKVEGYGFKDACNHLLELIQDHEELLEDTTISLAKYKQPVKEFKLPIKNKDSYIVMDYLTNVRKLDEEIVKDCINQGLIYEAKFEHAAVFVGYDEEHQPKFANLRGTMTDTKRDIAGSNKTYSFQITNEGSNQLHVFESAIDLLSYMTLLKQNGEDIRNRSYLSLDGVAGKESKALNHYLATHTIKRIYFSLDNDTAGINATKRLMDQLKGQYYVEDDHPNGCKDVNELLVKKVTEKQKNRSRAV